MVEMRCLLAIMDAVAIAMTESLKSLPSLIQMIASTAKTGIFERAIYPFGVNLTQLGVSLSSERG